MEKTGCEFCNGNKKKRGEMLMRGLSEAMGIDGSIGVKTEHGFFVDENVLYYEFGKLGTEGIVIHFCPQCGRNLDEEQEGATK